MLHDPQDWSVVLHTRQHVFHDETDSENYHRTPMHLESVPSIAAAEVRVEDHLLVMEMGIEVARALKVRNRCAKLSQKRRRRSVADRRRNSAPFESPHLHALRGP